MARQGWFYRIRVATLAAVLGILLLYAWHDRRSRLERNAWQAPLRVGLVFLRLGNVDEGALARMMERSKALEARLSSELRRYRPGAAAGAIQIIRFGPVEVSGPPHGVLGDTLWDRARVSYELWRYTREIDRVAHVPWRGLDSRIYVLAEEGTHVGTNFVEGFSEAGGRIGVARVNLDRGMVDFGLFVAAHELLHTLGASDKYAEDGKTLIPDGLADPLLSPLFPQPGAEVMARNRVFSPTEERPPDTLAELFVGPKTAREIGWLGEPE